MSALSQTILDNIRAHIENELKNIKSDDSVYNYEIIPRALDIVNPFAKAKPADIHIIANISINEKATYLVGTIRKQFISETRKCFITSHGLLIEYIIKSNPTTNASVIEVRYNHYIDAVQPVISIKYNSETNITDYDALWADIRAVNDRLYKMPIYMYNIFTENIRGVSILKRILECENKYAISTLVYICTMAQKSSQHLHLADKLKADILAFEQYREKEMQKLDKKRKEIDDDYERIKDVKRRIIEHLGD